MHFCCYSKQETPLCLWFSTKTGTDIRTFWLLENARQFIERQNWWLLCCDGQMKYPIKAGVFFMLLLGYQAFHMWITLDTMRFLQAWHMNALHHTTHYALQIYLGCIRVGKSNEKSWTEWQRNHRLQLGRRLDACRRADIECSHICCWWETTCFLWSTATCIVEVISFFTTLLGCFAIKALELTKKSLQQTFESSLVHH